MPVIRSFRHKGLAQLYESGAAKGMSAPLVPKVSRILARLDAAQSAGQMGLPGWRLHPLKGDKFGLWSVWVSANWRIVFRFHGGDAWDVDLVDYH